MTLDPVFRSRRAIQQVEAGGFLEHLRPDLEAQHRVLRDVTGLLPELIDASYVGEPDAKSDELDFLQSNFFLVLFHSILRTLGCDAGRLRYYARLNYCIKGVITAGDNLFDGESKRLLPLRLESPGPRFESIIQLLCFDRLLRRVGRAAVADKALDEVAVGTIERRILDRLTEIGSLEGSEEGGVEQTLGVEEMLERVHRVRGGALFSLAFIAPRTIEDRARHAALERAERAVRRLGTAFQIVDDLTDFEFDLERRSHNILVGASLHGTSDAARAAMQKLWAARSPDPELVETVLSECGGEVLRLARSEGRAAFQELSELGFWMSPAESDAVVHAIVGIEGDERMERLLHAEPRSSGSHGSRS